MTTLMQWGNSDGIKGRCDDRCHSAKEPECHCMCGGRFHGAKNLDGGLSKAVEDFENEVIENINHRLKDEGSELQINNIKEYMDKITMQRNQYPLF